MSEYHITQCDESLCIGRERPGDVCETAFLLFRLSVWNPNSVCEYSYLQQI